jgi:hypothetical protein
MAARLFSISFLIICICFAASAQSPHRYDIIIDELFPDPTPVIGLPNAEFIELKNISANAYDLSAWKISNQTNFASIKRNFILQPDSFVVLCALADTDAYSKFGAVIGISGFPSLNNEAATISLLSPEGLIVYAVNYDKSWYQNEIKNNGGWSLEMIDTKNPCTGHANWTASRDSRGGTPGRKNSTDGINPDLQAPALNRTYTVDSTIIVAIFDEPLDSLSASSISNYQIDGELGSPKSAFPLPPLFNEVQLTLPANLKSNTIYQLSATNVEDCAGNSMSAAKVKIGLPSIPDTMDIVINEILFNPATNGYDYVELYNRSEKTFDMKQLYIANQNTSGSLANIEQLSSSSFLFFPGDYYVFTENRQWLDQNYQVRNPDKVIELPNMPSLPDDHGNIVLLDQSGKKIDQLEYDHKWHFRLIDNEQGVALERISYDQPTQSADNWTSGSSTSGYGTPTYQNSEFLPNQLVKGTVTIVPRIFSPDDDGYEDNCLIYYQVPDPGYVANITIFDASGRSVRYLAKNAILGLNGNFRWDGLDDNQKKLSMGIYVVLTEIFNLNGYTKKFKNTVTLAKRL